MLPYRQLQWVMDSCLDFSSRKVPAWLKRRIFNGSIRKTTLEGSTSKSCHRDDFRGGQLLSTTDTTLVTLLCAWTRWWICHESCVCACSFFLSQSWAYRGGLSEIGFWNGYRELCRGQHYQFKNLVLEQLFWILMIENKIKTELSLSKSLMNV